MVRRQWSQEKGRHLRRHERTTTAFARGVPLLLHAVGSGGGAGRHAIAVTFHDHRQC